jgi:hypothetical protein
MVSSSSCWVSGSGDAYGERKLRIIDGILATGRRDGRPAGSSPVSLPSKGGHHARAFAPRPIKLTKWAPHVQSTLATTAGKASAHWHLESR